MIRTQHDLTDKAWFITFTCYQWIPLFGITDSYNLVYNWLNLIADKYQIQCFGFVIMPNHVHLLLNLPDTVKSLNTVISNGKRFMAYELINRLQQQKQYEILDRLSVACSEKEKAKGQKHKVFELSFDAKPVYTLDFLNQKLVYMHNNPVSGKWNLCSEFTDYPHSSAAFYLYENPHPFLILKTTVHLGLKIRSYTARSSPRDLAETENCKLKNNFVLIKAQTAGSSPKDPAGTGKVQTAGSSSRDPAGTAMLSQHKLGCKVVSAPN